MIRAFTFFALLVLGLAAVACGSSSSDDAQPAKDAGASSDPISRAGACPTDVVQIVVTVDQWSEVVERLAGGCGEVTTIISGDVGDPHDFEPTPADNAAFTEADLVVMNGADYDHWAESALETLSSEPATVNGGEVVGIDEGGNPHLWYSPTYVDEIATAVTTALINLSPDATDYLTEQATAWRVGMEPYVALVSTLASEVEGRTYAATESVYDDMAMALGLTDVTPGGYRSAAANESDPAPGDVHEFTQLLESGGVDVLIYNIQTEGAIPEQLREAAEDADVAVVEVTETAPDGSTSFVDWQVGQLEDLARALGVTT